MSALLALCCVYAPNYAHAPHPPLYSVLSVARSAAWPAHQTSNYMIASLWSPTSAAAAAASHLLLVHYLLCTEGRGVATALCTSPSATPPAATNVASPPFHITDGLHANDKARLITAWAMLRFTRRPNYPPLASMEGGFNGRFFLLPRALV